MSKRNGKELAREDKKKEKGKELAQEDKKKQSPNNVPRNGVIHMIEGGPAPGDSHEAKKRYARNYIREEMRIKH